MGESDQGAMDSRSVSSQWLNHLENFVESYATLGTRLEEEKVDWQIHENSSIVKTLVRHSAI